MAGLLAAAAEGALAGAGKGIADAGQALLKDQMDQGIVRLQNQYATERQTAEFGHQESMQKGQQTFERGLKEEELEAHGRIAGAEMQQKGELAGQHETAATERSRIAAKSRVDAATVRGAGAAAKANAPKPWQVRMVRTSTFDEKGRPTGGWQDKPILMNPNNGALYAQLGDKLFRWNTDRNAPDRDPKSLARLPVRQEDYALIFRDPNGVIPAGHKGAGLTNAENFERSYGYLPSGITSRLTQGGMVNDNNPDAADGDMSNEEATAEAAQTQQEADDNAPAVEP